MQMARCLFQMSDKKPCGRLLHRVPIEIDPEPVCFMHSRDPNKPRDEFDAEIDAILSGTSAAHRSDEIFDCRGFVFIECDFSKRVFTKYADFQKATFGEGARFWSATFGKEAHFGGATFGKGAHFSGASFGESAYFLGTTFSEGAYFSGASFGKEARFLGTTFGEGAYFGEARFSERPSFFEASFGKGACFKGATFGEGTSFGSATFSEETSFMDATFGERARFEGATFGESVGFSSAIFTGVVDFSDARFGSPNQSGHCIADFSGVLFRKPELVRFLRVNQQTVFGFCARFVNCNVVGVSFDAVRWYRQAGCMVLQDELDIVAQAQDAPSYEEVAIAYRRLISNFEQARAYDLVEDCTIGEFEMKRRNPDRFLFSEWLKSIYELSPFLRTLIGEQVSVVNLYRLTSLYGTSYQRALGVLIVLLFSFGLCFSMMEGIQLSPTGAISTCGELTALCKGALHSFETAMLQRAPAYEAISFRGRMVEILEQIVVAGQVTLLLFALRRRFRR